MRQKILRPHLKTARDARAVRTREALRQALLELLDQKPLAQITIRDICEVGDVGYTTFFRHYPTKESLLDDVAEEQMRNLVGLAHSVAAASDTWSGAIALCSYVDQHRNLWTTLLTGGAAGVMRNEFMRQSGELSKAEARTRVWPPPEIAMILVVSSTIELLTWWLRDKKPLSVDEVAEILEHAIIAPTVNAKRIPRGRAGLPQQAR